MLTADEEATLVAKARAHGTTPADLVRKAIDPILAAPGSRSDRAGT